MCIRDSVFQFRLTSDSPFGGAIDTIRDFQGAGINFAFVTEDRVDLSAVDANALLAGNQAFSFNGTAAGGVGTVWVVNSGTDTIIYANTSDNLLNPFDNLTPEIAIRITDGAGVTAADYWAGDFVM